MASQLTTQDNKSMNATTEIPLKQWLCEQSMKLGITFTAAQARYARGKLKPQTVRKVNSKVIMVSGEPTLTDPKPVMVAVHYVDRPSPHGKEDDASALGMMRLAISHATPGGQPFLTNCRYHQTIHKASTQLRIPVTVRQADNGCWTVWRTA